MGIILIATNLRSPIVAIGPVTPEMMQSLSLSPSAMGLLTSIPLLCFGLGSAFMPRMAQKWGLERLLLLTVVFLSLGLFVRSLGDSYSLFGGSILVGLTITMANVLIPPFIRKYFPRRLELITAIYLTNINFFSAFAVGFAIRLGKIGGLGWRSSIGAWLVLSLLSLPVWIYIYRQRKKAKNANVKQAYSGKMWRSAMAWQIALFMGMQSILYYVLAAWLPTILRDWGMAAEPAGWALFVVQITQVPALFIGSMLATRARWQKGLVWTASALMLGGLLLLLFFKTRLFIPAGICLGVSIGLIFSMATVYFSSRTHTVDDALELSGMSQTVGYLIAGCFPPIIGFLFDWSGHWQFPLIVLMGVPLVMCLTGLLASRNQMIGATSS